MSELAKRARHLRGEVIRHGIDPYGSCVIELCDEIEALEALLVEFVVAEESFPPNCFADDASEEDFEAGRAASERSTSALSAIYVVGEELIHGRASRQA